MNSHYKWLIAMDIHIPNISWADDGFGNLCYLCTSESFAAAHYFMWPYGWTEQANRII